MVVTINLLAWRGPARARKNRRFALQLLLAVVAAMLLTALCYGIAQWALERQQQRNHYLLGQVEQIAAEVAEITELRSMKERQLQRVGLIRALQSQRSDWVAVFADLAAATPAGLYFTELSAESGLIRARGYAVSNEAISALLRALEASEHFSQATLSRVDRDQRLGESGSRFSLQVTAAVVAERIAGAESVE